MEPSLPTLVLQIAYVDRPPERREIRALRSIIGRETGDIVLNDPESSALHAEIDCSGGHVIVRDLGSSNGTLREGKRLPQFALFAGQTFRCGKTDITLLEVRGGAQGLRPGQTAVGSTRVGSSSTVTSNRPQTIARTSGSEPASSSADGPPKSTLVGPPTPSTSPTLPGGPQAAPQPWKPPSVAPPLDPGALVTGGAPSAPPSSVSGASSGAEPPPSAASPEPVASSAPPTDAPLQPSAAYDIQAPTTPSPTSTPASTGYPEATPSPATTGQTQPTVDPSAYGPPPSAAAADSVYRPPVANAVIKGAGATGPTPPKAAGRPGPGIGKLLAYVGLGLGGLALLTGIGWFVFSLLAGRQLAFVEQIAREMPQDAVGFVAVRSPRTMIELFGDEVPTELRDAAREELELDPYDPSAYEQMGIDVDAPLGAALLHVEDAVFAVSVGVSDGDKLRQTVRDRLADITDNDDLRWVDRSFGDVEGMWMEEPLPIAAIERDERLVLIWSAKSDDPEVVQRQAETVADLEKGSTLADRPGFSGLVTPEGDTLSMVYVDGASARASVVGGGVEQMAARMAMADIDAMAFALSEDGSSFHLTIETVLREGASGLELVGKTKRKTVALDRIGAPVLAELDAAFDPEALDDAVGGVGSMGGIGLKFVEDEVREELGIDLRSDVVRNLSGELGAALLQLPPQRGSDDVRAVGWVGVADEKKARETAERMYAKAHDRVGAKLEQIEGTTVYVFEGPPRVVAFIHEGHLWFAVGEVDVRPLIKGPDDPFLKDVRHASIGDALRPGGTMAGFVDIKELLYAIRPLLRERDREQERELAPVLSLLETATVRGWAEDRTGVVRLSVHTSADQGLRTLLQETTKLVGTELAEAAREAARREKCLRLVEHVQQLTVRELESAGSNADISWEIERKVLEECQKPEMSDERLDCYLQAETLDAMTACDEKHASADAKPPVDGGKDPLPVPYVDDIWPNTVHLGAGGGRPDASVNYAVDLGRDPYVRGNETGLVTIVEFADFQCPYCSRVTTTLDEVLAEHGSEVRLVFRHNPLPGHPKARIAAKAALAAGKQGKFWEMHDKLFAHQYELTEDNFRSWAGELGLDLAQFDRDFDSIETERRIDEDIEAAKKLGARGTPSFFVNGRYLAGAQPASSFVTLIEEEKIRAKTFVERRGDTRKDLYTGMIAHFAPEVPPDTTVLVPPTESRHIVSTTGLPQKGASSFARVQIVECADFDCPFCQRALTTIDKVLDTYPTQVSFHFAHNPLAFHAGAEPAARAAIAAEQQGKFWEMHDKLFEDQKARATADFERMAKEVGLDVEKFRRDMDARSTTDTIAAHQKLCTENEATGTPSFFINGRLLTGAQPFDRFQAVIDEELAGAGGI